MEYIDLKDYLKRLLGNWFTILLCGIIGASSAFVYSKFIAQPIYSSSLKIGVYSSDWSNKSTNMSEIQASLGLIETCTVVLQDDVTAEAVSNTLKENSGIDVSAKEIKSSLSFAQVGDSQWLKVTAKTKDPELSALICSAVAANASSIIVDSVANIEIKTLGQAKVNNSPVSPNVLLNTAVGFIGAIVLVCLIMFLIEYFDNTIRDESKLTEKYDLSILGIVPNLHNISKNTKTVNRYYAK